jgi:hypothetical protein
MRWIIPALALGTAALLSTGCVAVVAAGAAGATVAYVRGALQSVLDAPIDRSGEAATQAVKDLKFSVISSKVDAVSGEIVARTSQDTKIEIQLKKLTGNSTSVDIRVGVFGDEAISLQVLEQIKRNL